MTKDYENMNENEKLHLLVSVANLYYGHNMTQSEIAEGLSISRSKISRLLKEAREKKVVEIIIREPWDRLLDLEKDLKERYELKDIRIINTKGSPYETILAKLGEIGAYYVNNLIEKNTILGISWGNTIYNLVHSLSSNKNIPITVVQIMGAAFKEKPEIDAMDLARHVAKVYGGKYHYLYAPLFVEDKNIKESLIKEPYIADTLELAKKSNVLLTGIGPISSGMNNSLWRNYINSYTQYLIQSQGAVGHIGGHFYDIEGNKVDAELEDRLIGMAMEDILTVPNIVAIAGGEDKAKAILGALRGKYIDTLIMDDTAALKILELENN